LRADNGVTYHEALVMKGGEGCSYFDEVAVDMLLMSLARLSKWRIKLDHVSISFPKNPPETKHTLQ